MQYGDLNFANTQGPYTYIVYRIHTRYGERERDYERKKKLSTHFCEVHATRIILHYPGSNCLVCRVMRCALINHKLANKILIVVGPQKIVIKEKR